MLLKFKYILFIVIAGLIVSSCTKELSNENGFSTTGTSIFTCSSTLVYGVYVAGTALNNSDTIALSVTVDSIGTYYISTDSANGISFSASGSFAITGVQTVLLKGSGTPSASGTFNFTPRGNNCFFTVTVNPAGTTPTPPSTDCKACEYVPVCQGSTYTYIDSTLVGSQQRMATYLSVTDTTFDGAVYQKVVEQSGSSYLNCDNGVTTVVAFNITSVSGTTTLSELKQVELEANANVGDAWSSTIVNGYGQPVSYEYKIAEKGISKTVLGVAYSDVIHVNVVISVTIAGVGTSATNTADYYYAKGIGLIEATTNDYSSGALISGSYLKSYSIP